MSYLVTPYNEDDILILSELISTDELEVGSLKKYFYEKIKNNNNNYKKTFNEILEEFDIKSEKIFVKRGINPFSGKGMNVYTLRMEGKVNKNMIVAFRLEEEL